MAMKAFSRSFPCPRPAGPRWWPRSPWLPLPPLRSPAEAPGIGESGQSRSLCLAPLPLSRCHNPAPLHHNLWLPRKQKDKLLSPTAQASVYLHYAQERQAVFKHFRNTP